MLNMKYTEKVWKAANCNTILDTDDTLTQTQIADLWYINQSTISKHLKTMGKIQRCQR